MLDFFGQHDEFEKRIDSEMSQINDGFIHSQYISKSHQTYVLGRIPR